MLKCTQGPDVIFSVEARLYVIIAVDLYHSCFSIVCHQLCMWQGAEFTRLVKAHRNWDACRARVSWSQDGVYHAVMV